VKPRHCDMTFEIFNELPGKLEMSDGYVMLWRS
jgi:hypothetical protein